MAGVSIGSPEDLARLRRIGRLVAQAAREMAAHVRPGVSTAELDAIGKAFLKKHGARSAPRLEYGFPGFTCISVNDQAAHGIPGRRLLEPGDIVNIDVSAELEGYFGDTGLMVEVPPVSARARQLCACSESALRKALRAATSGAPMNAIGRAVEREALRGGFSVLRDLGGHGVGRHIHEAPRFVPNFYDP